MWAVPRVQLTPRNRCRYQVSTLLVRSALVKPIFRLADSPEAGRILPTRPFGVRVRVTIRAEQLCWGDRLLKHGACANERTDDDGGRRQRPFPSPVPRCRRRMWQIALPAWC